MSEREDEKAALRQERGAIMLTLLAFAKDDSDLADTMAKKIKIVQIDVEYIIHSMDDLNESQSYFALDLALKLPPEQVDLQWFMDKYKETKHESVDELIRNLVLTIPIGQLRIKDYRLLIEKSESHCKDINNLAYELLLKHFSDKLEVTLLNAMKSSSVASVRVESLKLLTSMSSQERNCADEVSQSLAFQEAIINDM
jgi:hypothetical protein